MRPGSIRNGFKVEVAHSGERGLDLAQVGSPGLVILDLMLPDIDGMDICRKPRESGDVAVAMVAAHDQVGDSIRGLEAGADDCPAKPFAFEELAARVFAVLRRRSSSPLPCSTIRPRRLRLPITRDACPLPVLGPGVMWNKLGGI